MPRKTREQKMAAALRRMKKQAETQKNLGDQNSAGPGTPSKSPPPTYKIATLPSIDSTQQPTPGAKTDTYDYSYIPRDLRKIFFLSATAIVFEVAANLTTRLQFVKLLLRRFGIEI